MKKGLCHAPAPWFLLRAVPLLPALVLSGNLYAKPTSAEDKDIRDEGAVFSFGIQLRDDDTGDLLEQPYSVVFRCHQSILVYEYPLWDALFQCKDQDNTGNTLCSHTITVDKKLEPLVNADTCRAFVIRNRKLYQVETDSLNAGTGKFPAHYPFIPEQVVLDLRITNPVALWTETEAEVTEDCGEDCSDE